MYKSTTVNHITTMKTVIIMILIPKYNTVIYFVIFNNIYNFFFMEYLYATICSTRQ